MAKSNKKTSEWFRQYDLSEARRQGCERNPEVHQSRALDKLTKWYTKEGDGGILVLPTGAGKTFTATHFLCRHPISDGRKVLWLAHTHHLLEQGFLAFHHALPLIAEPHRNLRVRVVSGTTGHFPVHSIKASDDVLVCSVQTASRALANNHPAFKAFLDAAKGNLFVVFDEAHHSPAPSYRRFVEGLREQSKKLSLLGLTATPTYTDKKKKGWLGKLFPEGIVHQEEPSKLMAAGVLAKPVLEQASTNYEPTFDDREYDIWINTYRDLPEEIIQHLATNRDRNERIANHYVAHRERYGKTIIFADRWLQCDQLRETLIKRGIKADVIYSHVDANLGSSEARQRRTADENSKVLRRFKDNELDVLINVRMLTEGTDVPDVQTVFLTRQTTSQILLTQMVGRALRGPKFGGTKEAYIVSFIDDWKHHINWATFDQIGEGLADDSIPKYGKRPPLQLISIDLVRQLAQQMDSGINVNPGPYATFLPVGWYRVEFETEVKATDTDDVEPVDRLIMVFEGQKNQFQSLIKALQKDDLSQFESAEFDFVDVEGQVIGWRDKFFDGEEDSVSRLNDDIVSITRHMAQNDGIAPRFFPFTERQNHDLDVLATKILSDRLSRLDEDQVLEQEYVRDDRLWKSFYYHYDLFKSHYNGCVERQLHAGRHGGEAGNHRPVFENTEVVPDTEPSDETKKEVKVRDGNRCLCCGVKNQLTVDHVAPRYYGGMHESENLQTLCKVCNRIKDATFINFRNHRTTLTSAPSHFLSFPKEMPSGKDAQDRDKWERYLRQCINFFYKSAAVEYVTIGGRGKKFREWEVGLYQGNPTQWLESHLDNLAQSIRSAKAKAGYQEAPESIGVVE